MINPAVFLKRPIQFQNICTIYPPSVQDIVDNPKATQLFKLLTYSQDDIEDFYSTNKNKEGQTNQKLPTPLEFLLANCYQSPVFAHLINDAFVFFLHETCTILYEQKIILLGTAETLVQIDDFKQLRYLSEDTFFDFQNVIRMAMGAELVEQKTEEEENPILKRIKAASRRRKRLAEKTRQKQKGGISLTTTLGAICCMGIGLTPLNIGEISYASVSVLMSLYQQKEKYQTDIDSLMAGASPKKVHPKYWIREQSEYQEVKI